MSSGPHFPSRGHSRSETPLPPPPPLRERGDSNGSQQGAPSVMSNAPSSTIQLPSSVNASVRTSPQKTQIRTYDSKLISREMDRLAMHTPTPPLHGHSHSHSHAGTPHSMHGHAMQPGSVSTLTLVPSLAHTSSATLATSPSVPVASDDPWSTLHLHVLPMFNGEALRIPIEDLNALVKRHLQTVVSKSPSRAITTLENDLVDLLSTGMITLNSKLNGLDEEKLLNRVIELWGFFWTQLLPYLEGVFLPLQMDSLLVSLSRTPRVVRSNSPVESTDRDSSPVQQSTLTSAPIDVRTLTLRCFRDAIITPIFERLHQTIMMPKSKQAVEYNQPRFQQMLLVLGSIQKPTVTLAANDPPLSPGEHAITHLFTASTSPKLATIILAPYPGGRRRTLGPSSFSGGVPRDRRGRIARRDDPLTGPVLGLIPGNPVDGQGSVDPDETPTANHINRHEDNVHHIQRMREEREFLDSLKSPDLETGSDDHHAHGVRYANVEYDDDSADDRSEEEDFGSEIHRGAASDFDHHSRQGH